MSNGNRNQYTPDYVSPPGETLIEKIEELGMSQAELARRLGRPKKTINEIIRGKTAITPKTALQLERVLGIPARFWNNREQQYRQYLAREEEENYLRNDVDWLQRFPVKEMITMGWIRAFDDKVRQLQEVLEFFGIASPQQWETVWSPSFVAFRKARTFDSDPEALSAWLRQGELEAQEIQCRDYSTKDFQATLRRVRQLTQEPPEKFQPELVNVCAEAGVAVVFIPQLPKARVSGATRWLTPTKALIQLSLRYKKDDHLWFTFFHEAGHILLHGKRDIFIEDDDSDGAEEQEADEFAAKTLIPPSALNSFLEGWTPGRYPSKKDIRAFADEIGVAPGIVVGRLQHDELVPYTHYNDLKRTFKWVN
jgi:HTH-type transcriptional regulator/antitoxin HigA